MCPHQTLALKCPWVWGKFWIWIYASYRFHARPVLDLRPLWKFKQSVSAKDKFYRDRPCVEVNFMKGITKRPTDVAYVFKLMTLLKTQIFISCSFILRSPWGSHTWGASFRKRGFKLQVSCILSCSSRSNLTLSLKAEVTQEVGREVLFLGSDCCWGRILLNLCLKLGPSLFYLRYSCSTHHPTIKHLIIAA